MSEEDARLKRYNDLLASQESDDTVSTYQGLILGLTAAGFKLEDNSLNSKLKELLNSGQSFPGSVIAMVTDLAIDAKMMLQDSKIEFLIPSNRQEQLLALSQLCYGIAMGLAMSGDTRDPRLVEYITAINDVSRVDYEESDFDAEDLKVVTGYLAEALLYAYGKKDGSVIKTTAVQ